jgi:aquaporin Z
MSMNVRRYLAEILGTMILVFVGGMAILSTKVMSPLETPLIVIAFGFGLALWIGLYAVGEVSGGHFNPAVSLAMLLDGRLSLSLMIGYWVSQVAGAVLGGLLLLWASSQDAVASTATVVGEGVSVSSAFMLELAMTAFFVMVILKVTKSETFGVQALSAISIALVGIHLAMVPFTGASVNPARTLGSAIIGNTYPDMWLYMVAPLVGAAIGWLIYQVTVFGKVEVSIDSGD